jgi:hypothetical protein
VGEEELNSTLVKDEEYVNPAKRADEMEWPAIRSQVKEEISAVTTAEEWKGCKRQWDDAWGSCNGPPKDPCTTTDPFGVIR